jgi:membrane-bound ClpP family serine protease
MESTFSIFAPLICFFGAIFLMFMIFLAASIRVVREDKRLSVYRLGRYLGDKGPGIVLLIPFVDRAVMKDPGAGEKISGRGLVGVVGETRTTVYNDGQVSLAGEVWDAVSRAPISAGQRVRAVRIILEVEKQ